MENSIKSKSQGTSISVILADLRDVCVDRESVEPLLQFWLFEREPPCPLNQWEKAYQQMNSGAFLACFTKPNKADLIGILFRLAGFEIKNQLIWFHEEKEETLLTPILLVQKPLCEKSIVENVIKWGTGAFNVDDCRIAYDMTDTNPATNPLYRAKNGYKNKQNAEKYVNAYKLRSEEESERLVSERGRYPANVVMDKKTGILLDKQSGISKSTGGISESTGKLMNPAIYGTYSGTSKGASAGGYGDTGGASRYFYCVEGEEIDIPVSLLAYLIRLLNPPDGVVMNQGIDPLLFQQACERENVKGVG